MSKYLLIVIVSLISTTFGCATQTIGPLVVGKNTYIVSREEGAFPTGNKPLLKEALKEAEVFCSSLDKIVKLIGTEEHRQIIGAYPKATVTFSCVENKINKTR